MKQAKKKTGAGIVLEAELCIPAEAGVPDPTKAQLAKLAKAFKSDILASLGVSSDVMISKMRPLAPPRSKR
jgi:hypothetical protein